MTILAMTIPVARRSAISVPRRDMALSNADDLTLNLTFVESDRPDAAPVDLAGIGPQVRFTIWYTSTAWDYGWFCPAYRTTLVSVLATVPNDMSGRATVTVPRGGLSEKGRRLGYSLQLDWQDELSEVQWGALNLRRGSALEMTEFDILDSFDVPITDSEDQDIEA